MKTIFIKDIVGEFGENKDLAKKIREESILPALAKDQPIALDFEGVSGATQSFIHALISDALRNFPDTAYDNLIFRNASPEVRQIISIVFTYMQQG